MQHKLFILRREAKISQENMAKMLGISEIAYRLKETGKNEFKASEMFTIAKYFNKTIEEIFLPSILQNGVKIKGE